MSEAPRDPVLDGVRGLAILLVVVMHSLFWGLPLAGGPPLDQTHLYPRLALLGWCGVDVFFVLSGYLITGILVRAKGTPRYFRNFYARRALRIFPLYYLVIGLLLFVLPRPATTAPERLSYLLYYQNIRFALWGEATSDPARLVTWSLAIEEQFYLVWPAVVWWCSPRALVRTCAILIATAVVLRVALVQAGVAHTHFLTPCRMDTLAVGALLALRPLPSVRTGGALTLAGGAGLVWVAVATGSSFPESPGQQQWGLLAALMFAAGLLILARSAPRLGPWLGNRALRSLGKYSYCIYLVHLLVIEWLAHRVYFDLPAPAAAWLLECLPATALLVVFTLMCLGSAWLVAFVSWHAFERWFLALKRYFPNAAAPDPGAGGSLRPPQYTV